MSSVTNVMLTTRCRAENTLCLINGWLDGRNDMEKQYGSLVEVTDQAGGTKGMEAKVYLGAFNYLPLERFVLFVRQMVEDGSRREVHFDPRSIQLFICDNIDWRFREIPLIDY